jgi:hypothetical protein
MSTVFWADIHVGNPKRHGGPLVAGVNDRCREILSVLHAASQAAVRANAEAVYVLGDLFDSPRPSPQVLTATMQALEPLRRAGIELRLLVGNHDRASDACNDHALGPMGFVDEIAVVAEPTFYWQGAQAGAVLCVPFLPQQTADTVLAEADKLVAEATAEYESIAPGCGGPRLLLAAHLGIIGKDTPPFLRDAPGAIRVERLQRWCADRKVEVALAGDWHGRTVWRGLPGQAVVAQVGALVPTGWDNPGLDGYGSIIGWTPGTQPTIDSLPGPRFLRAPSAGAAVKLASAARANGSSPRIIVEVTQSTAVGRTAARAAADAAKSAGTLDEALAAYVGEMALDDENRREEVLRRAGGYLRGKGE